MATQTSDYLGAIEHLPVGGELVLTDVSWESYEQLLTELGDSCGLRISYDQGRMEIMSPSQEHEEYKEFISRLVYVIAEELLVEVEGLGSTTFKQQWLERGVEPDACFYIQNARIAIEKRIDLRTDPPPDVVVEIDVSRDSRSKLSIYQGMKVPEVWLYDESRLLFLHLSNDCYVEKASSLAFPLITSEALTTFLERSKTEGQTTVARTFRKWIQELTSKQHLDDASTNAQRTEQ